MTDVVCEQLAWQQFAAEDADMLKALTPYLEYSRGANWDPSCFPGANVELDLSVLGDDDSVTLASVVQLFKEELDIPASPANHMPTACWDRQLTQTHLPAKALGNRFSTAGQHAAQPIPQQTVLTTAERASAPMHVQSDAGTTAQSPITAPHLPVLTPAEIAAGLTPLRTHAGQDHAAGRPACPAGPLVLPVLQPFLSDVSTNTQVGILQAAGRMTDTSAPSSQHLASAPFSTMPSSDASSLHTSACAGLLGLRLPLQSTNPSAGGLPATDLQVLLHNYRVLAQHALAVDTATAAANGPGAAYAARSSQLRPWSVPPHSPVHSPPTGTAALSCASHVYIYKDGELFQVQSSTPGSSNSSMQPAGSLPEHGASPWTASAQAAAQRQRQSCQDSGWVCTSGNLVLTLQQSLSISTGPGLTLQPPGPPAGRTVAGWTHATESKTPDSSALGMREPSAQEAIATAASAQAAVAAALAVAKAALAPEEPAVGKGIAAAAQHSTARRGKRKARSPAGKPVQELVSTNITAGTQLKRTRTRTAKAAAAVNPTQPKPASCTAPLASSAAAVAVSAAKPTRQTSKAVLQGSAAGSEPLTFCEVHGSSYPAMLTGVSRSALGDCWEVRYSGSISQAGQAAENPEEVFLGGFATECEAAHAYDLAALACEGRGAVTNFHTREYGAADPGQLFCAGVEAVLGCISNNQLTMTGFQPPFNGVYPSMALEGRWEARLYLQQDRTRYRYLGSFSNEFAAASAVDAAKAAVNIANSACTCGSHRQT